MCLSRSDLVLSPVLLHPALSHDTAELAVLAICSLLQGSDASNGTTRANSSSAPEPKSAGPVLDWVYNTKGTSSMQSNPGEPLPYLAIHHGQCPHYQSPTTAAYQDRRNTLEHAMGCILIKFVGNVCNLWTCQIHGVPYGYCCTLVYCTMR